MIVHIYTHIYKHFIFMYVCVCILSHLIKSIFTRLPVCLLFAKTWKSSSSSSSLQFAVDLYAAAVFNIVSKNSRCFKQATLYVCTFNLNFAGFRTYFPLIVPVVPDCVVQSGTRCVVVLSSTLFSVVLFFPFSVFRLPSFCFQIVICCRCWLHNFMLLFELFDNFYFRFVNTLVLLHGIFSKLFIFSTAPLFLRKCRRKMLHTY